MNDEREALLQAIERERDRILAFYRDFIRAKSPNPPGDTRAAAAHIGKLLGEESLPYRTIAPQSAMPNIVASFACGGSGRHLVLNGHIDVFPVGDAAGWTRDPWGAELVEGKIYGRGACDMKAGTSASIFTYIYLSRMRERLKGRLTLTCVSDEETFGPWGARYLIEHHPEVHGDCLLNGEPSGLGTIRFGEKGPLWLLFTIRTPGAHGAYTHYSASATKIAVRLIAELEAVGRIVSRAPDNIVRALDAAAPAVDAAMGKGAAAIVQQVTLNIGVVQGGLKVNMVPGECRIEADIRLPLGVEKDEVMREVRRIATTFPEVAVEEINYSPPSWCDPYGEMVEILSANATALNGTAPVPIVSLGGTGARLWRYKGVPAYVYGPPPSGMGSTDEHVKVEDFFKVVKTHLLSAYDYLSRG